MKIKFIKLINNERVMRALTASKACDSTSTDICYPGYDFADCTVESYDKCYKDYAACYDNSKDICAQRDHTVCYEGETDIYTDPF